MGGLEGLRCGGWGKRGWGGGKETYAVDDADFLVVGFEVGALFWGGG